MRFVMLSLGLMALFVPFALAALKDTHPFDVRDLVAFDRISEPKLSPDGRQVVFTVSALDLDANKRRSDLWLTNATGRGSSG
jgi:hypothetical protein